MRRMAGVGKLRRESLMEGGGVAKDILDLGERWKVRTGQGVRVRT